MGCVFRNWLVCCYFGLFVGWAGFLVFWTLLFSSGLAGLSATRVDTGRTWVLRFKLAHLFRDRDHLLTLIHFPWSIERRALVWMNIGASQFNRIRGDHRVFKSLSSVSYHLVSRGHAESLLTLLFGVEVWLKSVLLLLDSLSWAVLLGSGRIICLGTFV